jgi:hypothetical protein
MAAPMDPGEFRALTRRLREDDRHDERKGTLVEVGRAAGPLAYTVEENRQLARELDAYLQGPERPPLLNTAVSLAVGAGTRDELEHRIEALRHRYGTVALQRPLGLQPRCSSDHLPRADGGHRP